MRCARHTDSSHSQNAYLALSPCLYFTDRRHRSPRHQDRDRRDSYRGGDDRYRRDDRRDDRRPPRERDYRDRDDGRDRRRYDDDRGGGGYRRGGGDHRESRDDRGRREQKERPASPERRSPTPPGAAPLSQRWRKASGWDVTAPGYEQYSAMQAKQTGKITNISVLNSYLLLHRPVQSSWS
jgi:splicing factor U2AF 65 kDa subunit